MTEEAAEQIEQPQQQGLPPEMVLNILQQRAQRDETLALHLEAATLFAATQVQQRQIEELKQNQKAPRPPRKATARKTTKKK